MSAVPVTTTTTKKTNREITRAVRRGQAGMTLLEIMIVLAILGLLMGVLVGPRIFRALSGAKKDTGVEVVRQFSQGYIEYERAHENDQTTCPEDLGQAMIREKFVNWKKVDKNGDPKDTWNIPLRIVCPGTEDKDGIDVSSAGPDKKWDTADDILSWKL